MSAQMKEKMEKTIANLTNEFKTLRTGRANPAILDGVKVETYGQLSPLKQVAGLSTPDAKTIVVQPYDKSQLSVIEKAIQIADLGLNPLNDGNVLRIVMPDLTAERREELKKTARARGEEAKVAIRNVRRDENEAVKKKLKDKALSEDEEKKELAHIQKITDEYVVKVDDMVKSKEKELSEI